MKIAILGAPGSGKTTLAKRLTRSLNREAGRTLWKVIDQYTVPLGIQLGTETGYVQNVQIMTKRWELEDQAKRQGYNTITCGSIYDTITYAAQLNLLPPVEERERLVQYQVVSTMMSFFNLMEASTVDYSVLFYLPYVDPNDEMHSRQVRMINAKLPEVLEAYGKIATVLEGHDKQKLRDASKVTRFIQDKFFASETSSDERSGV